MKSFKYYFQKVIAILFLLIGALSILISFNTEDKLLNKIFIIFSILMFFCSFQLFKIKKNNERILKKEKIISNSINSPYTESNINQYNILENITKRIDFKTRPSTAFLVDDTSKKFAYVGKKNTYVFNYKDLVDFEYKENGQVLISGKTLPTVVGGATFGVVGSIIGSSGKRKQSNVITESNVILYLNNLITPSVKITVMDLSKISFNYKEQVADLIGMLNYIKNNN